MIQEERLYVYNMHNITEKHFSITITRAEPGRVASRYIIITVQKSDVIKT
jgi:hypothetical protein